MLGLVGLVWLVWFGSFVLVGFASFGLACLIWYILVSPLFTRLVLFCKTNLNEIPPHLKLFFSPNPTPLLLYLDLCTWAQV